MLRVLVTSILVATVAPAWADPSAGVVVSGFDSKTGPLTRLEAWLGDHSFQVDATALDKDAKITMTNCLAIGDLACARGVVEKRAKADNIVVVLAQASGPKKSRDLQLSAYWIAKNRDVMSLQRMCNHCTGAGLNKTLDGLMTDLTRLVPAMTGKVQITSNPSGLLATIDNEAAGVTPVEKQLAPGPHEVALTRDGKIVNHETVMIVAGEEAVVGLVAPPPDKPKSVVIVRKSKAVPITMMALGGAAIATGAVFYEIGGPTGHHLYYTDLKTPSYFIAGGGAALALIGTIWLLRGGTTSTPTAMVTPSGASIGWAGRF